MYIILQNIGMVALKHLLDVYILIIYIVLTFNMKLLLVLCEYSKRQELGMKDMQHMRSSRHNVHSLKNIQLVQCTKRLLPKHNERLRKNLSRQHGQVLVGLLEMDIW